MNAPEPIKYVTPYKTVILSTLDQLVTANNRPCIDGGTAVINGKPQKYYVAIDNKPELAAQVAEWTAAWTAYNTEKAAEFERNVPGLRELEAAQDAAYNDEARYNREFERMMESECGTSPKPLDESLPARARALAFDYPRAATYLRAKNYTYASNHHKYGAGKKAMALIADGGSLDEAESILHNWLPENWD